MNKILFFLVILSLTLLLSACGTPTPSNTIVPPSNSTNSANNTNEDANVNIADISVNSESVYIGSVFIKGYNTPSESFGISADDGSEIGLGSYDSMKEQFRAYIGEKIKVRFTGICRSGINDCCRTLFPFCGTVKSWEPLNLNINQ